MLNTSFNTRDQNEISYAISFNHPVDLLKSQISFAVVPISETRMRFELIQNGFAIRCLNHSAILSFFCGEQRNRTFTTLLWTYLADKRNKPLFTYSPILSEKQDLNLQPPASKAGKQPIVIFPDIRHKKSTSVRRCLTYSTIIVYLYDHNTLHKV